jgi:hypothetical protein
LNGDQFIAMHDELLPSEIGQTSLHALSKDMNNKGNEAIKAD